MENRRATGLPSHEDAEPDAGVPGKDLDGVPPVRDSNLTLHHIIAVTVAQRIEGHLCRGTHRIDDLMTLFLVMRRGSCYDEK
ncbi:hypothetical protein Mmc1_3081 [Magnetococcus marinus MC-1]|uniref:Uncharacterized protein n=1 Tax=Magnetococcus marinus (strain ATCC BAA-1437 / JCM 17883 / MC-1) TaxID=156889 RepID=A0LC79_MAGMM|nr:hypothetical protein Mmc1_3081 [Magnetococcus marinus MC-1]